MSGGTKNLETCGINGCTNLKTDWQAFCAPDWYRVPKPLRDEIWRLYREERGSANHLMALAEAKRLLEARDTHAAQA